MRLQKATEWIKENFKAGSEPARQTIYKLIEDKKLPGMQLGTQWFVDVEAWELQNSAIAKSDPKSMIYAQRIMSQ